MKFIVQRLLGAAGIGLALQLAGSIALRATENAKYLFLDPSLLTEVAGAELRVNPPAREDVVLRPDKPWERRCIGAFLTVRKIDEKYRMWYTCQDKAGNQYLAYAESDDGLRWVKPELGIYEFDGDRKNNILIDTFAEGTVFQDPNAIGANEDYVYLGQGAEKGFYRFTSADGLHWKRDAAPLLPFRVDTQDVVFWDHRRKCYVLYLRAWDVIGDWNLRKRKVAELTLDTLAKKASVLPSGHGDNPTNPRDLPRITDEMTTVLAADELDPPNTDVYNSAVQPYPCDPEWYVGFPSFFRRKSLVDGRLEVQFVGSHDGTHWYRYDHAAYVRPGLTDSDSSNRTYMGVGLIVSGDDIWQYGCSYRSRHGVNPLRSELGNEEPREKGSHLGQADGVIKRYVQRIDGFVSLDFSLKGGRCKTAPLIATGARLHINFDTGAMGRMRIALLDQAGVPLPGFSMDDCDPLEGNSLNTVVSWKGQSDIASLMGKKIRLEIEGTRSRLYSFSFEPQQ